MKASLQLKLTQQLMLTPQLQQAIRLLQLSTADLTQEIQEALEANPLLEITSDDHDITIAKRTDLPLTEGSVIVDRGPVEHYASSPAKKPFDGQVNLEQLYSTTTSLHDHLLWQLQLTPFSELDYCIGVAIIDAIDGDGLLRQTVDDIRKALLLDDIEAEHDEIEAVRHRILRFDPLGVGAENLSECLLVQLEQIHLLPLQSKLAKLLITKHLNELAHHNYAKLLKRYHLSEKELAEAIAIIQGLNPRPGELIEGTNTQYVIPDVHVRKESDQWLVRLNNESIPSLSINNHYANLIGQQQSNRDNRYLKSNLQEAKWFLKSIQSRQDTLLRVAMTIVKEQQAFLDHGEEALKPMILNDIASQLDMHESTVSRVTTQKYIHTPRGIFELKYFFSSHVNTQTGGELSSKAIRAQIKKLIAEENRLKPLSDNKIALILREQGIQIARRTVTKYRESLGIASSTERKSLPS